VALIFDRHSEELYRSWQLSPQGRAIEKGLEELLVKLLAPLKGERALDIGCGTGNHLLLLHRLGLNITGLDASPYMIKKARERIGDNSALITYPAEDLPFEDNEFDISLFINTLEFLDDPLQALREAGRVTGRHVFVGFLNSLSWNGLKKRFKGIMGDPLFGRARLYNLWQLKSLLRAAYGDCPISWGFIRTKPPFLDTVRFPGKEALERINSPFASFFGVSIKMVGLVRTNNVPVRMKFKTPKGSLAGIKTMGDLNRLQGVSDNERGLSV
jgi:SAM-dependent methyltransferase